MFGSTTNYWTSWDIIDDYTIRVNFSQYLNTLMRSWENYFFVSPTAYEKNGIEWVRTHMVGTAAFSQTQFLRDVSTTLVRNPVYWQQGKPYLDKVEILYVVDQLDPRSFDEIRRWRYAYCAAAADHPLRSS